MHLIQAIIHHDETSSIENQNNITISESENSSNVDKMLWSKKSSDNMNDDEKKQEEEEVQVHEEDENIVEQAPTVVDDNNDDDKDEEIVEEENDIVNDDDKEEIEINEAIPEGDEEANYDNDEEEEEEEENEDELEAKAIAEATASADASYTPPTSLLNSSSPYPLIRSVDGMSLKKYNPAPSVFTARGVPVPLRGKLNVPIHVTIGGSVVDYKVESKDFDIGFGVVAEREEGVTVVSPQSRVDSHVTAVTGKFLVGTVPCALIFTFDNEYSWFREKRISYRITVKPPTRENIISGRKLRAKKALEIVSQDKDSAEERLENVSSKRQELVGEVEKLEKELEEKKKSLGVVEKEEGWLKNRVQLRGVQENLLTRRLNDGWEDEEQKQESLEDLAVEI